MTEPDKRAEQERIAKEAERLRTDEPFAMAVFAAIKSAEEELAAAEKRLVQAALTDEPTGRAAHEVRLYQAKVEAIKALTTEIAALIVRGTPRVLKPVA